LTALERPRILRAPYTVIDLGLLACLAAVALQTIPLAPALRERLAPGAIIFDQALRFAGASARAGLHNRPTSIDPGATRFALLMSATIILLFWNARSILAGGGLRLTVRGIAWLGLALAPLTIVTHALSPHLYYGRWKPYTQIASPYGPFVNRNDLACWLVMAIPLTVGYICARVALQRRDAPRHFVSSIDAMALWLTASVCLMLGALIASVSRAGLTAFAAACLCFVWLSRRSLTPRRAGALVATVLVILAIAASYANLDELMAKAGAVNDGFARRLTVWRFASQMARDFWPAGTGAAAFDRAILLYDQPYYLFYVNHAHNQYLQFLVEGGLFLIVPVIVVCLSAVWLSARQLFTDRTPVFWIRAGAVSGLVGVGVDSVWESTMRTPANAVLLAILAAIAMHQAVGGNQRR
jgi:O-antigen ligase